MQDSAAVAEVGRSRRWGVRSLAKQGQAIPLSEQACALLCSATDMATHLCVVFRLV